MISTACPIDNSKKWKSGDEDDGKDADTDGEDADGDGEDDDNDEIWCGTQPFSNSIQA